MDISVFGLGYVGCVSVGCLAQSGHRVIGVDVSQSKVDLLNEGKPTIVEPDIAAIIGKQWQAGRIAATGDADSAIQGSQVSMVCVGTPMTRTGSPNVDFVLHVARQIGEALQEKDGFHTIAIRSTVPPGTTDAFVSIVEEVSGKTRETEFGVAANPEFLREGSAVDDFLNPSATVIGSDSSEARRVLHEVYAPFADDVQEADVRVVEMLKYVANSFHALKVAFANEVGSIAKQVGLDSHKLMRLFCMDTRLNISAKYLMPGFAYGGSCLPKDLKALCNLAHDHHLETPVLDAIHISNEIQKRIALELIVCSGKKRVALLGLAFKEGTDDLRSSASVDIAEALLGKGYELLIYDKAVHLSRLTGANRAYIAERIPHLAELIYDDLDYVVANADVLVFTQNAPEFRDLVSRVADKRIVDLVRVVEPAKRDNYAGVCW